MSLQKKLCQLGWAEGLDLRTYQREGVLWLLKCYDNGHGCILGDEMGLGKTCQTIGMLTMLTKKSDVAKPHLIVSPRSVLENWEQEINRFNPLLKTLVYIGDKEKRAELAENFNYSKKRDSDCDVLLTTYEICLKDYLFLQKTNWGVLVVDEGHRLKNKDSLLYITLEQWKFDMRVLLTGTPVQNNLTELYSLLSFVNSDKFKLDKLDQFVEKFSQTNQDVNELHSLMKPYFLRRTKAAVLKDLPDKTSVVLYHGLSPLQKKLYKAILTKDIGVFESSRGGPNQTRLMNILMQLRKCVNHPYLFDGVEPEPFILGEHLVEVSSKLTLIDKLLDFLQQSNHKVLLFSQMTHMLDVIQDYLGFRGYTYERLDGSVRGEERFLAVKNFNENEETFVFLLSTKAGGQGLNLTSADTVIFVDSDFNPQNDLQAAARAHRIGQERPVKIIRLIGKYTVEEIILRRAEEKLELTEKVIESGQFASTSSDIQKTQVKGNQLQEILKFGVDELLKDSAEDETIDFKSVLGDSKNGQWVSSVTRQTQFMDDDENESTSQSMYMFEGTDYSKEPSSADLKAFDNLLEEERKILSSHVTSGRALRKAGSKILSTPMLPDRKPRQKLTTEQLEERRKKRQETAEKRAREAEEQEILRAEKQKQKRKELWKANKYVSVNVELDSSEDETEDTLVLDEMSGASDEIKPLAIKYVMGDVTHPFDTSRDNCIVVHCADDSGKWGRGGLFSAISARSQEPENLYQLAGKMKDLALGDCHMFSLDDIESREDGQTLLALIIAQERNKKTNQLSSIKLPALRNGLKKVCKMAQEKNASVHLPRIGHDTPAFNWYGTERLIRKHLSSKGIPTLIYYFPRNQGTKRQAHTPKGPPSKVSKTLNNESSSSKEVLPSLFSGVSVYLHKLSDQDYKRFKRFIIAYDGDVHSTLTETTSHLVAQDDSTKEEIAAMTEEARCKTVTTKWLEDCLSKGKLLSTEDYKIE